MDIDDDTPSPIFFMERCSLRYNDETTEGIVPADENGGVLTEMADALLLSIDGSQRGEDLVLRVSQPSTPTCTVQRVLVCSICGTVVAKSTEAAHVYDEPVLFASEIERGLRQHEATTGHRQARREDRVLFVGEQDAKP